MGLKPWDAAQESALGAMVESRRLERVPADPARARAFLERGEGALEDVALLRHAHTAYNVAYDACHDAGEATLAAYGLRTRGGAGHHEALGRVLRIVFPEPPADAASRAFDQLRRARNANRYDARPVGMSQVTMAAEAAAVLLAAARHRGIGT